MSDNVDEKQEAQETPENTAEKNAAEENSAEETAQESQTADAQTEWKEDCPQEEEKKPSAEELLAELNNKYLLLRADFDNYRKRMAREANETRERSKMTVVADFLPVYDFFVMAMDHAEKTQDFNALKQGMQMIFNSFQQAFDGLGVKEIQSIGKPFDPAIHEAAKTEPSDNIPEGTIIQQWKAGYKIGERLVRPAMVVVSSGPAKKEEPEKNEQDSEENSSSKK